MGLEMTTHLPLALRAFIASLYNPALAVLNLLTLGHFSSNALLRLLASGQAEHAGHVLEYWWAGRTGRCRGSLA